jgi:MinD-like ATPase involved in chromosome partitioning or flagellar assembly
MPASQISHSTAGRVITFYSYKGGTGRSMLMANVAWILASNGRRVLAIDWDLEAPGLHRFFDPFLQDPELTHSQGVIDALIDYSDAAVTPGSGQESRDWFHEYANWSRYAVSLEWEFPGDGTLDLIPAGRQAPDYARRVNSFDWAALYERFSGGLFLEAVRQRQIRDYDFVLIDSRTGVSDTSGICTVSLPDDLVVCFTLNHQSILGASAVARSIVQQRTGALGDRNIRIWPVPTRVENAEQFRRDQARLAAQAHFNSLLSVGPGDREKYWGVVEVPYIPYYAYEEVLAVFADRPGAQGSMLGSIEFLIKQITAGEVDGMPPLDEHLRADVLRRSGWAGRGGAPPVVLTTPAQQVERAEATADRPSEIGPLTPARAKPAVKAWWKFW